MICGRMSDKLCTSNTLCPETQHSQTSCLNYTLIGNEGVPNDVVQQDMNSHCCALLATGFFSQYGHGHNSYGHCEYYYMHH